MASGALSGWKPQPLALRPHVVSPPCWPKAFLIRVLQRWAVSATPEGHAKSSGNREGEEDAELT